MSNVKKNTYRLTGLAILTAIIIVLQIFTTFVKFGPFSITLALIPMVVGAAMYGVGAGAYLGAVLGVIVTIMCITGGDVGGAMVWAANPVLCAVMCVLKTAMAGLAAGLIYKALSGKNKFVAVLLAAIASPIVNTGIFIIGMLVFFKDLLAVWAGGSDLLTYIIVGLTGVNFLVELGVNVILTPMVVKIIDAVKKTNKA
ncbi:MAG: ECF transporter S component [Ruminococcus sp.]|nr:ECF transporter S component [Ruminococcus sp.]